MARQTLLTPEVHAQITNAMRTGAYATDCAAMVGVAVRTHDRWMERGRAYEAHLDEGGKPSPEEERYLNYMVDCEKARAEARVAAVGAVAKAVRNPETYFPGWRAGIEFLRRTDPSNWDQLGAHKVELTGRDGGPVQFEVGEMEKALSERLVTALPKLRELAAGGEDDYQLAEIVEDATFGYFVGDHWVGWNGDLTTDDLGGSEYSYTYWLQQPSSDLTFGVPMSYDYETGEETP